MIDVHLDVDSVILHKSVLQEFVHLHQLQAPPFIIIVVTLAVDAGDLIANQTCAEIPPLGWVLRLVEYRNKAAAGERKLELIVKTALFQDQK